MTAPKISLKVFSAPATGLVLDAPQVLVASDQLVDYTCGRCASILLLHAEKNQVYGLLRRTGCGSYNLTDTETQRA
jgi:hypothetical protein